MRKVIRAESMGYCMGVERAVTAAEEVLSAQNLPLYALGELIHNEAEINRLKQQGLIVIADDAVPPQGSTAIIRAHGLHPFHVQKLQKHGVSLIDASCPLVVRNQKQVKHSSERQSFIIILGKKEHAEIRALVGFTENYVIISTEEEARTVALPDHRPLLLIAQTTFEVDRFNRIKDIFIKRRPDISIPPSICGATQKRQQALEKLAAAADVIVVVGSRQSSNTLGLYHKARSLGKETFLAENAHDIDHELFAAYKTIGLTAGASAPEWLIDEVEKALLKESPA
jgi:(E)-4-hydroxy-3-methyl-but-2-enyl pyrophosphate reductase